MFQADFLLVFILAHLIGDFVLQTNKVAKLKSESVKGVMLHSLIVTVIQMSVLSLFGVKGALAGLTGGIAHFLIDLAKLYLGKHIKRLQFVYFILDQAVHIFILFGITKIFGLNELPFLISTTAVWIAIQIVTAAFVLTVAAKIFTRDIFSDERNRSFFRKYERISDSGVTLALLAMCSLGFTWGLAASGLLFLPYMFFERKVLKLNNPIPVIKFFFYVMCLIIMVKVL